MVPVKRFMAFFLSTLLMAPLVMAEGEGELEAGYGGLTALGVGLIAVGVVYYSLTKRKLLIVHKKSSEWGFEIRPAHPYVTVFGPVYPITIHHFLTITGTLLAFVHFLSSPTYSGLRGGTGLGMAILLILLNLSGFFGRYVYGRILIAAKKHDRRKARRFVGLLGYWKTVHTALAVLFAILLAVHLAIGD
ncbi:hypothetical protein A3L02_02680 [Thermococcus celer Vu 13 = JCM 8558]|uniref:Uncharacterized protein n=2 Tax=Thermococcus celer TaxID=2264 RepID=A0A218P0U4_THECE|nr:hypothetical protein A3L02_02680 [Thermococcus celer Vu 13 = JCM 8558]